MRSTLSRPVALSSSYFTFEPFGISMKATKFSSMGSSQGMSCHGWVIGSETVSPPAIHLHLKERLRRERVACETARDLLNRVSVLHRIVAGALAVVVVAACGGQEPPAKPPPPP